MRNSCLLIDADGIAFAAAVAAQVTVEWEEGIHTASISLPIAQEIFDAKLQAVLSLGKWDDYVLAWSCPSRRYFRHDIAPSYKSNRKGLAPIGLRLVKDWAQDAYQSKTKPHLEADDVLGVFATNPKLITQKHRVIWSPDKDLMQVPGWHVKDNGSIVNVTPEDAARLTWKQALMGDVVDGIRGCPGIGTVSAEKILDKPLEELEGAVIAAFAKKKLGVEAVVESVNLVRILTTRTYDFKNDRPILWEPGMPISGGS